MPALLKTTQIQEPSSASVNIQLDSSGNVVLVPTAGSVGIGTTSPSAKLDVAGTTASTFGLRASQTDSGAYLTLGFDNSANNTQLVSSGNGYFRMFTNNTERMRITANGGVSFGSSGTAYGTSGQVLQSNGDAAPSWTTISATGALIRAPQILTSGTSYTTPSNCTKIYVEAVGAGGAGAGANANSGGGGGGGYVAKYFTVTGSTAYSYTIGASSGQGTTGNPPAGGNTTFTVGATTITGGGGSGGTGSGNASYGAGGTGGVGTNGDINGGGTAGAPTPGYNATGGTGGSSFFGGGGRATNTTGGNATGYGGGGGGGGGNSNGGAGTQGVIRIWEFT